jgi:hypothetical protein
MRILTCDELRQIAHYAEGRADTSASVLIQRAGWDLEKSTGTILPNVISRALKTAIPAPFSGFSSSDGANGNDTGSAKLQLCCFIQVEKCLLVPHERVPFRLILNASSIRAERVAYNEQKPTQPPNLMFRTPI